MRFYIISGEASGDLHGSNLIRELKIIYPQGKFRCWGGDMMEKQGGVIIKHYRDLAFMGFKEVILNIRTIKRNFKFCFEDVLEYRPDAIILIDYPGFNLRVARFAKEHKIPVLYYISPQVWAWKQSRVKKIRAYVDRMFAILPFEKDFYAKFGYDVEFTGNPLLDAIEEYREENRMSFEEFTGSAGLQEKPIIALLPGSRKQEIKTMLPVMTEVAGKFPDYQFVISAAPSISSEFIAENNSNRLPVFHGKTYSLLEHSSAALVTSGTATLETALFRIPEAVCYKSGYLSYQIAKKLIKVKYISLVNLIMDRVVVKELIQSEMNVAKLCEELDKMLNDNEYRNKMLADFDFLIKKLGGRGASRRTALKMAEFINSIRI